MMQCLQDQNQMDTKWMKRALALAKKAEALGEVPIGALLVDPLGKLVSQAYNLKETLKTPIGHAEILALHRAAKKQEAWRLMDLTMYVTLEPCPMCAGALVQSRVKRLVFGTRDPKAGACKSLFEISDDKRLNHRLEVTEGILKTECSQILTEFFRQKRQGKLKQRT